jgi:cytochrome c oxidase subunit III
VSEANLTMGHDAGVMEERPFAIPSKKLVMWLFIISDACTFGAMLYAYGYLRNAAPDWPHRFEASSIVNVAIMTFVLVTSSLTMLIATRAAKANDKTGALRFTFITVVLGLVFAALHLREWASMIHAGVSLFQNPWGGAPLFGATFFGVTGLHLAHVLSGAVALTVVALGYKRGRYNADDIEIWSLYWHFVDLVWMFVVPLVYLLNVAQ